MGESKYVKDKEKSKRIKEAVKYLKKIEVIELQIEISNHIDYKKHGISKAVNGDIRYVNGFIRKLVDAFPIFNYDYLMFGEGDLLIDKKNKYNLGNESEINIIEENDVAYSSRHDIIKILEREIERYKKREENYINDIKELKAEKKELKIENDSLRNENSILNIEIKQLNKKSRKQSGGSVSEQIADAG